MPIYEFSCKVCGREFEVLIKNKEEVSSIRCKFCGGSVERLMSVVNSILRGEEKGKSAGDRPRVAETHTCPTGTCSHLEFPGYSK